jgi:hypothetical protein
MFTKLEILKFRKQTISRNLMYTNLQFCKLSMTSCTTSKCIDSLCDFTTTQRVDASIDLGAQQSLLSARAAISVLDGCQTIVSHASLWKRCDTECEIDCDVARHAVWHDAIGKSDAQRLIGGNSATG